VKFVFFSGEEQGLLGSRRLALDLRRRGVPEDHLFFINMDMIGNNDESRWKVRIYSDGRSRHLATLAARITRAYTDVEPVLMGNTGASDHASFQNTGYPAIMFHENDFSVVYHTRRDKLSYMEIDYMADVVRAVDVLGEGEPSESILIGAPHRLTVRAVPNPTRGPVRFEIFVPGSGSDVRLTVRILDAVGRVVRRWSYPELSRGAHWIDWEGDDAQGSKVPGGVYFCEVCAKGLPPARGKVVVIR